jgi:hypothetical protein
VGVLPPGFQFVESYAIYVPLMLNESQTPKPMGGGSMSFGFGPRGCAVIGRLRPQAGLAQAETDLDAIFQATVEPGQKGRVLLVSLHEEMVGSAKLSLYIAGQELPDPAGHRPGLSA